VRTAQSSVAIPLPTLHHAGPMVFEQKHLLKKLSIRDQVRFRELGTAEIAPHPMMRVGSGDLEPWEVT